MKRKQNHSLTQLLVITFLVIFFIVVIITVKNYYLKKDLQKEQTAQYIYSAEKLAEYTLKNEKKVHVILNRELGLWDRQNKGKKLHFVPDLMIGDDEETSSNRELYNPSDIRVDREGNIYVREPIDCIIKKFDKNGNYQFSIGGKGQGPGEFGIVFNYFIDDEKNIHVFDRLNQRITVFNGEGQYLKSFRIDKYFLYYPTSFIQYKEHYLISCYDRETNKVVHSFDNNGKYTYSFINPITLIGNAHPMFQSTIAEISSGHLCIFKEKVYFSRQNPYEIYVFDTVSSSLNTKIFRKNSFMLPAEIKLLDNGGISHTPQVTSTYLTCWRDFLINIVTIPPPYIDKKPQTIIDLFNEDGQLLTTSIFNKVISISYIDKFDQAYAIEDYYNIPKLVRYKIQLTEE